MEKHVRDLIRQGEGTEVEFKTTVSSLAKIAKTISSMANTAGGILLIGVNDQGHVVGVEAEEERYMLEQASNWYIKPTISLEIDEFANDKGKVVLQVTIPNSTDKPHACLNTNHEWQYYIRSSDKSVLASDLVIKSLKHHIDQNEPDQEPEQSRQLTYNEQALVGFLKVKKKITIAQYAKLVNISKRRASKLLIDLVRDGHLFEHDYEKVIFYTLVKP